MSVCRAGRNRRLQARRDEGVVQKPSHAALNPASYSWTECDLETARCVVEA